MRRRFIIVFTAVFMFVCMGVLAQEQESQKTVAVVVPFDSSGVPQEEVDVVYRMFLSEFVRTGKCSVVDRSSFDKIKAQQNFQLSDWSNNDKVAKLGKALNANVVVTGQIMKFRNDFMFITQILDVNSTEIISSADEQVNDVAVLFGKFGEMCQTLTKNLAKLKNVVSRNYDIGDFGPGGGYVFYYSEAGFLMYKGGTEVICHYLECSPLELGYMTWCPCPGYEKKNERYCSVEAVDGVGAGAKNTYAILKTIHPGGTVTASNCAARACSEYFTGTTKVGEWYLPSKFELNLIYENLRKSGKIINNWFYWTSNSSYNDAYRQWFKNGWQISGYGQNYTVGYGKHDFHKSDWNYVMAVRAF